MVLFRAGGERFALPLEAVREVVVPQLPFARVPRAAPAVRGAMNLRGRVVAVVELAPLLGLPADLLEPAQGHVLILDRDRRGLGLLVASVLGVETLVTTAPPEARVPGGPARCVAQMGGGAVTVLDAEALEARAASLFQSPRDQIA
ncbi:MAG: chemotaxis protein CheW [Anaeromyxobacter sp. RBG_16_69_14]|nr:MAG: chemotaxis protein CheW [Anaeromyxobacter sp. RBG_16_69_14]